MNFVFFSFDPGHWNHFQVARMSMISAFVRYFFLTKLFLCLLILFLLTTMSVPVVKTSSLLEIVQVDDSFCFGDVDCSRSSRGCSESLPFLWRSRPDYFSLGAESLTGGAPADH